MTRVALLLLTLVLAGCAPAEPKPVAFDAAHEACAFCRMTGSNGRVAAQLVAPGEEPLFFDDIGCLRDHLAKAPAATGAVAFVTDYTTRAWVRADTAVFVLQPSIDTPMGSHVIAFASAALRDAAPDAKGGRAVTAAEILGRRP
jgi:copper chaperone NosL